MNKNSTVSGRPSPNNKITNTSLLTNNEIPILVSKFNKTVGVKNAISPSYCEENFVHKLKESWRNSEHFFNDFGNMQNGLKIINSPFNCAFIPDILKDTNFLEDVCKELKDVSLQHKNNDLFKFKCTEDLNGVCKPNIEKLCKYIEDPIKNWVQNVTGIQLNSKVSISCSRYEYSDVLLCHDDELEGRRIAFIFYLVPSWQKNYGGSLDLFSVDDKKRPYRIAERIYPQFNSFAFFEVSPISFHQVAEVMVEDMPRLSINGWFHGEPIAYPPRPPLKSPMFVLPGEIEEQAVYAWINPLYLDESTQLEIRRNFQKKSEIQLSNFIKKKKYVQLSAALRKPDLQWKWVGPPNKRHLEVVNFSASPEIVTEYITLMQSEAMFLILSQLTGLQLHHFAPQEDSNSDSSESESELDYSDCEATLESKADEAAAGGSNIDSPCTSKENGKATSNISMKRKSKNLQKDSKKQKFEEELEENGKLSDSPVGGLQDGWESDVEGCYQRFANSRIRTAEMRGEVSSEIRRWKWGAYSLMRDDDLKMNQDFVLDALTFCNVSTEWDVEFGGRTVYVAKGEEEELLTVVPSPNSLALVYRDKETFRFTKHINVKSKQLKSKSVFHEIFCEYREISRS